MSTSIKSPFSTHSLCLLVAMFVWGCSNEPQPQRLFPVVDANGKWGYGSPRGDLVIDFTYDAAKDFAYGRAPVLVGRVWGYIDSTGALVIEPQFEWVSAYTEEGAVVERSGILEVIDSSGIRIGHPPSSTGGPFAGGVPPFTSIDADNELTGVASFHLERSQHRIARFTDRLIPIRSGYLHGYTNQTGDLLIEPQFHAAGRFEGGMAPVMVNNRWGFIDEEGDYRILPQYERARPFAGQLAAVRQDGLWTFIDSDGKMLIEPMFAEVGQFSEGYAAVLTDDGWGFIDTTGRIVIKSQFSFADTFYHGLARVGLDSDAKSFSYIDHKGKPVWEPMSTVRLFDVDGIE